jgi:Uma2 family endonuclease
MMTTEEFLALPEDGKRRMLIRGRLWETPMTQHNRRHSRTEGNVTYFPRHWLEQQPEPRGEVLSGEVGFRLRQEPDTTVGIDVAYISAQVAAANSDDVKLIDAVPILAVEILPPSNLWQDVTDKIREYLEAGVLLLWVLDPVFRTVLVYRPPSRSFSTSGRRFRATRTFPASASRWRGCSEARKNGGADFVIPQVRKTPPKRQEDWTPETLFTGGVP